MRKKCSKMSHLILSAVLTVFCFSHAIVFSFSCVCSPSECEDISEDDCPGGGTVWDPCRCCRVCARVEDEPCGGPHGFYGTCADGLDCIVASHASGKPILAANSEGVCTRRPGTDLNCSNPSHAFGCNIITNRCSCERVPICGNEMPFMFSTRDECSVNLAVMLEHETSSGFQPDETSVLCGNGRFADKRNAFSSLTSVSPEQVSTFDFLYNPSEIGNNYPENETTHKPPQHSSPLSYLPPFAPTLIPRGSLSIYK